MPSSRLCSFALTHSNRPAPHVSPNARTNVGAQIRRGVHTLANKLVLSRSRQSHSINPITFSFVHAGDDVADEEAIVARRTHLLRVATELGKAPMRGQLANVGAQIPWMKRTRAGQLPMLARTLGPMQFSRSTRWMSSVGAYIGANVWSRRYPARQSVWPPLFVFRILRQEDLFQPQTSGVEVQRSRKRKKEHIEFKFKSTKFFCGLWTGKQVNKSLDTRYQYFKKLFDDELIRFICYQSNLYFTQSTERSVDMTIEEYENFLGIDMLMSIVGMPSYKDYWSHQLRYDKIASVMPLKRYQLLRKYLHFSDNSNVNPNDRYNKVRPVMEHVRKNCLRIEPEKSFSIDEMMIPYKGTRAGSRRQYIKNKPHPNRSVFTLSDPISVSDADPISGQAKCMKYVPVFHIVRPDRTPVSRRTIYFLVVIMASSSFKYDIITLIEVVESKPCLRDKTHPEYKNKILRDNNWREVFEYLDEGYKVLNQHEKKKTAETDANVEEETEQEHEVIAANDNEHFVNVAIHESKKEPSKTKRKIDSIEAAILKENKTTNSERVLTEDNFFTSFIPYVKDMSEPEKIQLQMDLLSSIQKIKQNRVLHQRVRSPYTLANPSPGHSRSYPNHGHSSHSNSINSPSPIFLPSPSPTSNAYIDVPSPQSVVNQQTSTPSNSYMDVPTPQLVGIQQTSTPSNSYMDVPTPQLVHKVSAIGCRLSSSNTDIGSNNVKTLLFGETTFDDISFTDTKNKYFGLTEKCVLRVAKTIENPALTTLFFDNWFSSLELISYLRSEFGILSLGVIRKDRLRGCNMISDKGSLKKGRGSYMVMVDNKKKIAVTK
ncbi:hypothetical protein HW555_008157 [Spodoptera exigua]|uniref:Transposase n=1 Tax=Spodoptera exigua TaxID=7107 RepID=A0A835L2Z9_SPOEX|nr:hypothetical protein HW555_008157 [Spodoptera exigua]